MNRDAEAEKNRSAGACANAKLRPACPHDAHAWASLVDPRATGPVEQAFLAALTQPHAWLRVWVTEPVLRSGASAALLACLHAQVIPPECELIDCWVAATERRRGHGRAALEALFAELRKARVTAVFLEVARGNGPARALYASMGFVELGVRREYYRQTAPPSMAAPDVGASLWDALRLTRRL